MLYQNISSIVANATWGSDQQESRVMYLTNGSREVLIRCRINGAWADEYNTTLFLPYVYTGASKAIWLISDTHCVNTDNRDNLIDAISDIGSIPDYVFHLGDMVQLGENTQLDYYLAAKATSSYGDWYEIPGNHDDNPFQSGDFTNWKTKLGYSDLNYTLDIGNVHFIFLGELTGVPGELSSDTITFLESELSGNTDKNLIVLTHHGVYDTTYRTTETGFYNKPADDIQDIIDAYRIDAWLSGHSHTINVHDAYSLQSPFAIYDDQTITDDGTQTNFFELSDSISISEDLSHCPDNSRSVYGTFKYGARKYGKNLIACETIFISEDLLLKLNGDIIKSRQDSILISASLTRTATFEREKGDTLSITENIAKHFYRNLSDSISFADSAETTHNPYLYDSQEISEYLDLDFTESISLKTDWKFKIKNPSSGKFVANLVNARKRWFVQRLNDESEAGFILDADDSNANTTIINMGYNELHIFYKDTLIWAGVISSERKIAKGNDIYWEVLAKDWTALLGKRFIGVEAPREFTTTDAGLIAKTLIQETQALTYGSFGITYGTIQTSIPRTITYDKKNILEAIKELSNAGQDGASSYGFDFEITPSKVFNIYYPYKGTIRNGVVFRYPGNCEDFEAFVDSWEIVNHEWGLGQHWTGNTAIVSRSDATSMSTYRRREAIKNYRDIGALEFLQDMVWQDIQWLANPSQVVRFSSRVDEKTDILDYNVGDGVTVVCDKFGVDDWLWVYERKVEIQDNDELIVTLTVGE
jgi:predicted phosphodiesterase